MNQVFSHDSTVKPGKLSQKIIVWIYFIHLTLLHINNRSDNYVDKLCKKWARDNDNQRDQ